MAYIENIQCPKCGAGHGLAVYSDDDRGHNGHCFKCGRYFSDPYQGQEGTSKNYNKEDFMHDRTVEWVIHNTVFSDIPHRGLSKDACEKYGVKVTYDEVSGEINETYFPVTKGGKVTGFKVKKRNKDQYSIGDCKGNIELFGQHIAGENGKLIVVTEGEEDCLAAYEMFKQSGKNYRVVSLPNGANLKSIRNNLEWLDKFESVVLSFDMDEPGQKCADAGAELLRPGKVKVMKYSEKDANDMLKQGKYKEYFQALYSAKEYRPDGIVAGLDTWERLKNRPLIASVPYPDHWEDMNKKTYGIRIGDLDTWTSGSGMGKSQIMREIEFHLLRTTEDNIGVIALEEPLEDSVEALMSLFLNKRIHLPDIRKTISEEEMYDAWLNTSGTGRLFYYDHFGSVDEDSLISKIRFLVNGCGCKYIILDHLSIVISEFAVEGGERERIDTAMSKLKKLTQELSIWIGLIVHLRKTSGGKSFEEGAVPTLDDLRGSGSIKQLSNSVFAISRNQQDPDPVQRNTSQIHVLKCRFTGRTGSSDHLYFNENTGRMIKSEEQTLNNEDEEF